MAPAVGSTEIRYLGISLLSRLASATSALWPEVPTGGEPQRMSCWAEAAEADRPITAATANVVRARLNIAFLPMLLVVRTASRLRSVAQHQTTRACWQT